MFKPRVVLSTMLGLALAGQALAQRSDDRLEVGDPAPDLKIQEWVKGEEFQIQAGQPYVVEFWATWCVPCRISIPHLSKLQERYIDEVTFVGVSNEKASEVKPFVRRMGGRMDYAVAVDQENGTFEAYMKAAGQDGIPTAFIVDGSKQIAFIGHPMSREFEDVLELVASGRYDAKLMKQARPILAQAQRARELRDWRMAKTYYDQVVALDARVFHRMAIEQFEMILHDKKSVDEAIAFATDEYMTKYAADAEALADLAELILTDASVLRADKARMGELALKLAEAAVATSGSTEPEILATLALAHHQMGHADEAINLQTKAYFLAKPRNKEAFKSVLDQYRGLGKGSRRR